MSDASSQAARTISYRHFVAGKMKVGSLSLTRREFELAHAAADAVASLKWLRSELSGLYDMDLAALEALDKALQVYRRNGMTLGVLDE